MECEMVVFFHTRAYKYYVDLYFPLWIWIKKLQKSHEDNKVAQT